MAQTMTLKEFEAYLREGSRMNKAYNIVVDGKKHNIKQTRASLAKAGIKHTFALLFRLNRNLVAYTKYRIVFNHVEGTLQMVLQTAKSSVQGKAVSQRAAANASKSKSKVTKRVSHTTKGKKVAVPAGVDEDVVIEGDDEE